MINEDLMTLVVSSSEGREAGRVEAAEEVSIETKIKERERVRKELIRESIFIYCLYMGGNVTA